MRLIGVAISFLALASCASAPQPRATQEADNEPKAPVGQNAALGKAASGKLLTRDEIMGALDPAVRAEVLFLYESWAHYNFGGNGINSPPRAKTAFARILCTGDTDLFMTLAHAGNPTVASYGITALSILSPVRLRELLPELVTRAGGYETLSGCIGGREELCSLAGLALPYLDFARDEALLTATVEAWLDRMEKVGVSYHDMIFADGLITRFGMDTILNLPYTQANSRAKLEVFQVDWSEREFSDEAWRKIKSRFGATEIWRFVVKVGVGFGRWSLGPDQTKFNAALAASNQMDGDDDLAEAARIDLDFLCEWLDPHASVSRYPSRIDVAKAVRELMTEEVLAGMQASNGPARPLFDRLLAELRELLAEPATPPQNAQDLAIIIQSRWRLTVSDDDLDGWLSQWPETYDLLLQGREHALDFQFIGINRSDKLLPRWWLQTLERGTAFAKEALLHELSFWHEHEEDARKDEAYCARLRSCMQSLARGSDIRLKWTARKALLREESPSSENSDAKLDRSRLLMSWLPELIDDYADANLPASTAEQICDDLRGIAWNHIFEHSRDDNTANQDDIDAYENDPFWALAQRLFLADTQVDEHPQVYSRLLTLSELRKLEKTPQECWNEYLQAKAALRGKSPSDSPNHLKPGRERK